MPQPQPAAVRSAALMPTSRVLTVHHAYKPVRDVRPGDKLLLQAGAPRGRPALAVVTDVAARDALCLGHFSTNAWHAKHAILDDGAGARLLDLHDGTVSLARVGEGSAPLMPRLLPPGPDSNSGDNNSDNSDGGDSEGDGGDGRPRLAHSLGYVYGVVALAAWRHPDDEYVVAFDGVGAMDEFLARLYDLVPPPWRQPRGGGGGQQPGAAGGLRLRCSIQRDASCKLTLRAPALAALLADAPQLLWCPRFCTGVDAALQRTRVQRMDEALYELVVVAKMRSRVSARSRAHAVRGVELLARPAPARLAVLALACDCPGAAFVIADNSLRALELL
jgi:hypothetical protein